MHKFYKISQNKFKHAVTKFTCIDEMQTERLRNEIQKIKGLQTAM